MTPTLRQILPLYLGAKVKVYDTTDTTKILWETVLVGCYPSEVEPGEFIVVCDDNQEFYDYEIRLQLRQLSSMREEELKSLCKDCDIDLGTITTSDGMYSFVGALEFGCFEFEETVAAINWARRNHFDCDGLIESGLADEIKTE